MWDRLRDAIETAMRARIHELYAEAPGALVFEKPPDPEMGDLALTVCFELARVLKRAPRQIAAEIAEGMAPPPGCRRMTVAGAGYLNFFLDRNRFLRDLHSDVTSAPRRPSPDARAAIVEHTNINPNKAAHIGHLRNAVLGDTLVRLLRFLGRRVEVQNYIDNTGVQVADVVVGFRELEGISDAAGLAGVPEPFDFQCWDVYSRVMGHYEKVGETEARRLRSETLKAIEAGDGAVAEVAALIAERNVRRHLATMRRIDVTYDLLPWEGDILQLRFWDRAFELLKDRGGAVLENAGKNAGCWIMPLRKSDRFSEMDDPDKVLVRSDGTVTYVGKDLAYQLWKFGLLGADFHYRRFEEEADGRTLWSTTADPGAADAGAPPFGGGEVVYNVIDVRQSYLQRIVAEGLRLLDFSDQADRSIHFSYEMVALSPSCAKELGFTLSAEDEGKSHVEMSGRKGLGVKADDLLDRLEEQAAREVASRNPELSEVEQRNVGRLIAQGALRYFMLKYTRNRVIAFDMNEALSFEGEAGPYVQYATVRAANILRKLGGDARERAGRTLESFDFGYLPDAEQTDTWEIVHLLSSLSDTASSAVDALEPSQAAHYAFSLAQKFNGYYHKYRILHEPDERLKEMRALFVYLFERRMRQTLDLLGIPVPERM